MNEFKGYHPIVNMVYFIFVIGFAMFFMNPVCLAISLLCAATYIIILKGRKAKKLFICMLPIICMAALLNPAFNHEGATILAYLPGGNPLTLESLIYGGMAAVMLASVIVWFSCFNEIMTSDKLMYLFGRIIPSLSLIMSMTLRFVPRFCTHLKAVIAARRTIESDMSDRTIIQRAKNGLAVLSVMVTWSLENSVETADSMRARGYGLSRRTAFSIFSFDRRDRNAFLYIACLGIYVLIGNLSGGIYFKYFPSVIFKGFSFFGASVFTAYFLLCILPVIIEIRGMIKWKLTESKI